MSRLETGDIAHIRTSLAAYDELFQRQTGKSMLAAAEWAYAKPVETQKLKAAVVPVTSGQGVISAFSESVCEILRFAGCRAWVTGGTDVGGLKEAYVKGADIVFMADDDEYGAFGLTHRGYSSNGEATGTVFAAGLELMSHGIEGKEALVLGAGPVGRAAVAYLVRKKALVFAYDTDETRMNQLLREYPDVRADQNWQDHSFMHILDATPCKHILAAAQVTDRTLLALPGLPIGASKQVIGACLSVLHNPLELGTIAMLVQCAPWGVAGEVTPEKE
ncbi:MAG: 3-methylornithyl-N6-L-lysine dehydrogenase PylD [Peptococcaceae bacterium]|jgi:pyrrolysine biosynthesis protein PylD|nr:3-methylornithyl-N6-L-lysine dehydrogenase PylD [Peptococcaceae bacterium]